MSSTTCHSVSLMTILISSFKLGTEYLLVFLYVKFCLIKLLSATCVSLMDVWLSRLRPVMNNYGNYY